MKYVIIIMLLCFGAEEELRFQYEVIPGSEKGYLYVQTKYPDHEELVRGGDLLLISATKSELDYMHKKKLIIGSSPKGHRPLIIIRGLPNKTIEKAKKGTLEGLTLVDNVEEESWAVFAYEYHVCVGMKILEYTGGAEMEFFE